MTYLVAYLSVGVGFYLAHAVSWPVRGATAMEIARGLLFGVLVWPLAAIFVRKIRQIERQELERLVRVSRRVVQYGEYGRSFTTLGALMDEVEMSLAPYRDVSDV